MILNKNALKWSLEISRKLTQNDRHTDGEGCCLENHTMSWQHPSRKHSLQIKLVPLVDLHESSSGEQR